MPTWCFVRVPGMGPCVCEWHRVIVLTVFQSQQRRYDTWLPLLLSCTHGLRALPFLPIVAIVDWKHDLI